MQPGEQKVVTFAVDVATELRILGRDFKWQPPSGQFKVLSIYRSSGAAPAVNSLRVLS